MTLEELTFNNWAARHGLSLRWHSRAMKRSRSSWNGRVVGFYSTSLTPIGIAVESEREPCSVQIYPSHALIAVPETE